MGDETFGACPNLKKVEFNSKLAEIGSGIFNGCTNLISIDYQGSKNQWEK
ncbi:MAG: leucine-rich repeat protein [Romboutsia timonensis]